MNKNILTNEEIENLLRNLEHQHIKVSGDGYHFQVTIVSEQFQDKSKVARQQMVYSILKDYIATGQLHALSMITLTPKEWQQHG